MYATWQNIMKYDVFCNKLSYYILFSRFIRLLSIKTLYVQFTISVYSREKFFIEFIEREFL